MQQPKAVRVKTAVRVRSALTGYCSARLSLPFTLSGAKMQSQGLRIRTWHPPPISSLLPPHKKTASMGWERWSWLTWTRTGACCPGSALQKGMQPAAGTRKGRAAGTGAGDSPTGHWRDGCCSPRRGKQHGRSVRQRHAWSGLKGQRTWEQTPTCPRRLLSHPPAGRQLGIKGTGQRVSPDPRRCSPPFL